MDRLRVLGRADVVDGRPAISPELGPLMLLDSESMPVLLASGDISELMLAISRSLLCCILLGR